MTVADNSQRRRYLDTLRKWKGHPPDTDALIVALDKLLDADLPHIVKASEIETGSHDEYRRSLLECLLEFRRRTHQESERACRQSIMRILGTITERFGSTSSWIFLADPTRQENDWITSESTVSMSFAHNTGCAFCTISLSDPGKSIVKTAALSRRPYLSNDVDTDPNYRCEVKATQSELACPILVDDSAGNEHLIGVINLESHAKGAFLDAHKGELVAAGAELAPHILIYNHLRRHSGAFGWHPAIHGWTISKLLEGVCNAISFTDDASRIGDTQVTVSTNALPRPSCTIWYDDKDAPPEESLYVRATSRFDHEYISNRRLPRDSFTGRVADLERGYVAYAVPDDLESFKRNEKARRMEMVFAVASPIYPGSGDPESKRPLGSLNLYWFKQDLITMNITEATAKRLSTHYPVVISIAAELSTEIGELIVTCQRLRCEVAAAYLRYRMHEHGLPGVTDFDVAKDVFVECLDAHRCSIFGRAGMQLRCLATSGLVGKDGCPVAADQASYDLQDEADKGITVYLGSGSSRFIRKASVETRDVTGTSTDPIPVNKYREMFALTESIDGPFLGISVDAEQSIKDRDAPLGVVRLVRSYSSKPFVDGDRTIAGRLASVMRSSFLRWNRRINQSLIRQYQRSKLRDLLVPVFGSVPSDAQVDSFERLAEVFPSNAVWNRHEIRTVLMDLINAINRPNRGRAGHGAFLASVRLLSNGELTVYAVHSLLSTNLPDEEYLRRQRESKDSVGLRSIKMQQVVSFDANRCRESGCFVGVLPESERVVSGVCVPVRYPSLDGDSWGVLSVDFNDVPYEIVNESHVQVVVAAAKKLALLGRDNRRLADFSSYGETWGEAFERFVGLLRSTMTIGRAEIWDANRQRVLLESSDAGAMMQRPNDVRADGDLNETTFDVPIWWGPFPTELHFRGNYKEHVDGRGDIAVDVSHSLEQFVASTIGAGNRPLFEISFAKEDDMDGIRAWSPTLNLRID